jgi:hypothetical protein
VTFTDANIAAAQAETRIFLISISIPPWLVQSCNWLAGEDWW